MSWDSLPIDLKMPLRTPAICVLDGKVLSKRSECVTDPGRLMLPARLENHSDEE